MSVKSFREVENLESSNPPSFEKNRAMELKISKKLQQQQTDNFEDLSKMTEEEKQSVFGKLSKEEAQNSC